MHFSLKYTLLFLIIIFLVGQFFSHKPQWIQLLFTSNPLPIICAPGCSILKALETNLVPKLYFITILFYQVFL